jgi:shikimate kinase
MERLSHDKSRPLLQTPDRDARLHRLARERDPLYRGIADLVFSSPDRSAKVAARALTALILDYWRSATTGDTRVHS